MPGQVDFNQSIFMDNVRELSIGAKYYHHILDMAKEVEVYLKADKDPWDALDFLLSLYQAVPDAQNVIRQIISEALTKTVKIEKQEQ